MIEAEELFASPFLLVENMPQTAAILLSGAVLAFGLNMSELLLISHTSALTLCVCGIVKFVLVILITKRIFHADDIVKPTNYIGIAITIIGVILYNILKFTEVCCCCCCCCWPVLVFISSMWKIHY